MNRRTLPLLLWFGLFAGVGAQAQSYLVLRLANVTGESTLAGHVGDIDIQAFSWGVSTPPGGIGVSTPPNFSDLNVMKSVDKTSPVLSLDCAASTAITSGVLYWLTTVGSKPLAQYQLSFGHVTVSSVSVSGSGGGGLPSESVSLHFASGSTIQWSYTPIVGGVPQSPVTTSFVVP